MQQRRLEQERLEKEDVTFLLEHQEPFLFPARNLEWMNITPYIHSTMQMVTII